MLRLANSQKYIVQNDRRMLGAISEVIRYPVLTQVRIQEDMLRLECGTLVSGRLCLLIVESILDCEG